MNPEIQNQTNCLETVDIVTENQTQLNEVNINTLR